MDHGYCERRKGEPAHVDAKIGHTWRDREGCGILSEMDQGCGRERDPPEFCLILT